MQNMGGDRGNKFNNRSRGGSYQKPDGQGGNYRGGGGGRGGQGGGSRGGYNKDYKNQNNGQNQ